jgi:hypothetical protein
MHSLQSVQIETLEAHAGHAHAGSARKASFIRSHMFLALEF